MENFETDYIFKIQLRLGFKVDQRVNVYLRQIVEELIDSNEPVSYTHLDVYKRQEVFRVNQLDAHSDHGYYTDYEDVEKKDNGLTQSLNGQWDFSFSRNVGSRPENFFEENFDASGFDKIMVPGHIELSGYDLSLIHI